MTWHPESVGQSVTSEKNVIVSANSYYKIYYKIYHFDVVSFPISNIIKYVLIIYKKNTTIVYALTFCQPFLPYPPSPPYTSFPPTSLPPPPLPPPYPPYHPPPPRPALVSLMLCWGLDNADGCFFVEDTTRAYREFIQGDSRRVLGKIMCITSVLQ